MSKGLFKETALNRNSIIAVVNDDDPTRFKIVSEIVSSEKRYVEQLNVLNSLYIVPIQAALNSEPILTSEEINVIFGHLNVIKQLNGIFFFKLKERLLTWNKDALLGDIFIDFVPYFKMYMSYVNNQETATNLLRDLLKQNTKFINFCASCDLNPLTQNQNLFSFLILPTQRIPRYLLLIRDLIKRTDKTHLDYEQLEKTRGLLEDVASKINLAIADHKNRDVIYSIQENFLDNVFFLEPRRKFVHRGLMTKICRSSKKKYTFFLFSDMLVYASKSGNKFKLHRTIELNEAFCVKNLPDKEKETNRFEIVSSEKSFVVAVENYSGKEEWLAHFKSVQQNESKNTGLAKSFSDLNAAPVWQPDISSKSCKLCSTRFSVFKRRHHCRKCGELVCNDCSKGRDIIKATKESVRICDNCVGEKSNITTKKEPSHTTPPSKTPQPPKTQKPPKPSTPRKILYKKHVVTRDYFSFAPNEISLKKGDEIAIIHKDTTGWWTGITGDRIGVFPSNHVSPAVSECAEELPSTPLVRMAELVRSESKSPQSLKARRAETPPASTPGAPNTGCTGGAAEVQAIGLLDYTNSATGELDFKRDDRLAVKYFNREKGWCFALNKETQQSGWVSNEFLSIEGGADGLRQTRSFQCSCEQFFPNSFRPTLCKECFHSMDAHVFR